MKFIIEIPDVDVEREWPDGNLVDAALEIGSWISYSSNHLLAITVTPVEGQGEPIE